MRDATIARNYAETLLALAQKADNLEGFGALIRDVSTAIEQDVTLRNFLESPRVTAEEKNQLFAKALADRAPRLFVRFLQALVLHRRQMLIPDIAAEYDNLLDEAEGRVHANVTVASPVDDAERDSIAAQLSRTLGRRVIPHMIVDPAIMGGVVVKVGDTVMDGSIRRRLATLAQRMRHPA